MKEFLDYLMTIRGRSPRTVDGYYIELRTFLRFLKLSHSGTLAPERMPETSISDISLDDIKAVTLSEVYSFLNFVSTSCANGAAARARKVSALNSFYNYMSSKALYIKENPLKNLDMPMIKKTLPKYLTLEESNRLLDAADQPESARNYCMLVLFLNCGMRLAELVGINRSDIRDDGTLKLLGKGNKERIVYLNDACTSAIGVYLNDSRDIRRPDDALFVTAQGRRLSPRRVEQIVAECLRAAGLDDTSYTPHKLRHTAATLMYQYGNVDVRVLKEILGHENLSTTEIYTHVSDRQMEKAAMSSPLSHRSPSGRRKNRSEETE
ncbi:MAG: tyrosine recombinase XerC [Oscillospiraceae bacterium]